MPTYDDPALVTCSRCGRTVSMYSDEFKEWVFEEHGDGLADPTCLDCLSPEDRQGFRELMRRRLEVERRLPKRRRK